MTYYPNRHDMIEADDIQDVQHVHIAEEHGKPVAFIKAILDPRKDYQKLKQVFLHLTNGINHVVHGPFEHANPSTSILQESSLSTEPVNVPPETPIIMPGISAEPPSTETQQGTPAMKGTATPPPTKG